MNTSVGVRCKTGSLQRSPEEGTAFTDLERVQDQIRVAFRVQLVVSVVDSKTSPSAVLGKAKGQLHQIFIVRLISTSFTECFLSNSVLSEYFISILILNSRR